MAGFYGADVAQLRSLAGVMGKAATTLEMQGMQLSGLVNNTTAWTGSDAQKFKSDWNSSHRPLLLKAAGMLKQGAKQLKANADEQDYASKRMGTSAIADLKGVYDTGMGAKALGATLWNAWKLHKLGFEDWAKTKELLTNWDDAGRWLKGGLDQLKNGGKLSEVLTDLKAGVPYAQAFEDASKFSQGMRIAGGIAGPLSIAGGIHDMISPSHDGWRGTGDRVAGGLSVVGGVGGMMLMTAGGAAMLGPIGAPIVIGAGLVAGAWALGNLVADNWDSISNFAQHPAQYLGDGLKEAGNFAKGAGTKVVDGVGNAAKSVGKFVGGIFG